MKNSNTTITMTTACRRLTTNPLIDVVTLSDCIETIPNSIPNGIWSWTAEIFSLSPSPIVTTLPP